MIRQTASTAQKIKEDAPRSRAAARRGTGNLSPSAAARRHFIR